MSPAMEKELLQLGVTLSHVTRVHIIEVLMIGPKSVGDVQKALQKMEKTRGVKKRVEQSVISQHLRTLRENDIVTFERQGKEIVYILNATNLADLLRRFMFRVNTRKNA